MFDWLMQWRALRRERDGNAKVLAEFRTRAAQHVTEELTRVGLTRPCTLCKHYEYQTEMMKLPRMYWTESPEQCRRVVHTEMRHDVVTGESKLELQFAGSCGSQRHNERPDYCGTSGRMWEPKE